MPRDDADALRRRLYAPDASRDDLDRYEAAAPGPVDRAPAGSRPVRRRAPLAPLVAAAVVLAAIGIAALRLGGPEARDGLRAPVAVTADDAERQGFLQNLAIGKQAGIAAYLVTHPSPPALRGATRFFTVERAGTGARDLDLAPVPADAVDGRATVLLVLGSDADAAWATDRRRVDATGEQQWVRQATRGGEQRAGVLTSATIRYRAGDRPVRLSVDVDDGVRWGVAVVFSD